MQTVMDSVDWGPLIKVAVAILGGGGSLVFWALRKYIGSNLKRVADADKATRRRIGDLKNQVEDLIQNHATDRQQWEKERRALVHQADIQAEEIKRQRQSIQILETAYKDSQAQAAALEARVAQLETELDEKTAALEAMRDRLHKAEIALAEAKTENEFYQKNNSELFDLLKRYQPTIQPARADLPDAESPAA